MGREYRVGFEIAGPFAMFTRPDTGSTPISYAVPTAPALKAMFEAVAHVSGAYFSPSSLEVCSPIRFERYITNYGGPLRKTAQISNDNNLQLVATILVDVCYKVTGTIEPDPADGTYRACHALQDVFLRRLGRGQCHYVPCLGWKEFVPSYFGPIRESTSVDSSVNLHIPAYLVSVFDKPKNGSVCPSFVREAMVRGGVLDLSEVMNAQ